MTRPTIEEVAEFFNDHVVYDTVKTPSRRFVAKWGGISVATAQRYLEIAEARRLLVVPLLHKPSEPKP